MQRFSIGGADADGGEPTRHALTETLGTESIALNRYRIPPETGLPSGLHTHFDQEEVFVVLAGELQFETLEGDHRVGEGEVIRFAPGEYQTGTNTGGMEAVVLAIGAPKESEAVRIPLRCPDCDERGLSPEWRHGEVLLLCPDCGGAHRTAGCSECGREEMQAAVGGEGEILVVCPDCGAERSEPQWRDR